MVELLPSLALRTAPLLMQHVFINAEGILATLSDCLYWVRKPPGSCVCRALHWSPINLNAFILAHFLTLQELLESCFGHPWHCIFTPIVLHLCFSHWWKWTKCQPLFRISAYFCFRYSLNVDHLCLRVRRRHAFWLLQILLLRKEFFEN